MEHKEPKKKEVRFQAVTFRNGWDEKDNIERLRNRERERERERDRVTVRESQNNTLLAA